MPRVFSDNEMYRRLQDLRTMMDKEGIQAAVATTPHNIFYLSGFWFGEPYGRWCAAVVPLKGDPVLISAGTETGRARAFTWFTDVREYVDVEPPLAGVVRLVKEALTEKGLQSGKISVEKDLIPWTMVETLQEALPRVQLVDISAALERQRLVKSAEEVALTRQGAEMCKLGVAAAEKAVHEGATELEVAWALQSATRTEFAKRFPEFDYGVEPAYVSSGGRGWGHAGPTARKIQRGDQIGIAATPIIMGYFHTLGRGYVLGPIPERLKMPHEVQQEAVRKGLEAVQPGTTFAEVDRITTQVFEKAGYGQHKGMGSGHSFGLMGPFWGREKLGEYRPYNNTVLQEGMITSMEPGIFIPGVGGFLTVDMVLVTKTGCQVLTDHPRKLQSLG